MTKGDVSGSVSSAAQSALPSAIGVPLKAAQSPPAAEPLEGIEPQEGVEVAATNAEFAAFAHGQVREYIQLADQKAALLFGAASTMIAFLYSQGASTGWLVAPAAWGLSHVLSFLASFGLTGAIVFAATVVFPRTKGDAAGLLAWNAIAKRKSAADYVGAVRAAREEQLIHSYLAHTYELAVVCERKYHWLWWSFLAGAVGFGASIALLVMVRASKL